MKKTRLKIVSAVSVSVLIVSLIVGIYYYKALRDHIFPSSQKNVTMQANINEKELRITYKWQGLKEFYTYADYIVIRYKYEDIEFSYDGITMSKEFYNSVRYLQGDFAKRPPLSEEKELVVPIDRNSMDGEIIIPIKSRNVEIEDIAIYYAHELSFPMDIPTGWVSKKIDRVN